MFGNLTVLTGWSRRYCTKKERFASLMTVGPVDFPVPGCYAALVVSNPESQADHNIVCHYLNFSLCYILRGRFPTVCVCLEILE